MAAFVLMEHYKGILISFMAKQTIALSFQDISDLYKNTDMRIAIMPGGMVENDFRYSKDPLWQKIFQERVEPHLEEIKAYPNHITDMTHFIRNDYKTAMYDVYQAYL